MDTPPAATRTTCHSVAHGMKFFPRCWRPLTRRSRPCASKCTSSRRARLVNGFARRWSARNSGACGCGCAGGNALWLDGIAGLFLGAIAGRRRRGALVQSGRLDAVLVSQSSQAAGLRRWLISVGGFNLTHAVRATASVPAGATWVSGLKARWRSHWPPRLRECSPVQFRHKRFARLRRFPVDKSTVGCRTDFFSEPGR